MIIRVFFVLFTLLFIGDAFDKWDGYSIYMSFLEFLPDLSLSFILWTIIALFLGVVCWLIIYLFLKIATKLVTLVGIETIIYYFIFSILPYVFMLIYYPDLSISKSIGLGLIIIAVSVVFCFWSGRKFIEKMVHGFDNHITPLIWLFTILFIFAIPLSFIKKEKPDSYYIPPGSDHGLHSDKQRPNIILVTMDALTARDMQLYGYDKPTTPFISEWAKDTVVFERAYSASNWTTPGAMTLMTGKRLWTHRAWYQAKFHPVAKSYECLPRVFRDYGYEVYGFVQNVYAHPETLGIDDYFTVKDKDTIFRKPSDWWFDKLMDLFGDRLITKRWILTDNKVIAKMNNYRPDLYSTDMPSEMIYDQFINYMSKRIKNKGPQQPFFAWLHVYPPHHFYLPPEPYMGIFEESEKYNTRNKQISASVLGKDYPIEDQPIVDVLRKRYDEFVLYSDNQFKSFLSRLSEIMDTAGSIIILSSDHGQSFSHGSHGHGRHNLYEAFVHIPLIIKTHSIQKGMRIDTNVEQADIAPTILDLANIPVPRWMEGRSLKPLISGQSFNQRPVFSMQFSNNSYAESSLITKGTIAVWEDEYKLIYYMEKNKSLLFDLEADPDEKYNLIDKKARIAQRLQQLVDENLNLANDRIAKSQNKNMALFK